LNAVRAASNFLPSSWSLLLSFEPFAGRILGLEMFFFIGSERARDFRLWKFHAYEDSCSSAVEKSDDWSRKAVWRAKYR
jgi:hypothetical protein